MRALRSCFLHRQGRQGRQGSATRSLASLAALAVRRKRGKQEIRSQLIPAFLLSSLVPSLDCWGVTRNLTGLRAFSNHSKVAGC